MVGVSCLVEELNKREQQRGDRTLGEAESQIRHVHQFCSYDLLVDSTSTPARVLAAEIKSYLDQPKSLNGMKKTIALLFR
jgi:chloramphenicol 3-O phosphotransferase